MQVLAGQAAASVGAGDFGVMIIAIAVIAGLIWFVGRRSLKGENILLGIFAVIAVVLIIIGYNKIT